ncbi:hypothetical protein FOCC_FOCC007905, partial [Frankliniella occidentalis]
GRPGRPAGPLTRSRRPAPTPLSAHTPSARPGGTPDAPGPRRRSAHGLEEHRAAASCTAGVTMSETLDQEQVTSKYRKYLTDSTGKLNFDAFCKVAIHFLDEDDEALQKELKAAFRLYDKEGNGYIPTSSLKEILIALDDQLTPDQLNEMIAEIDTDDSGTVDFDEFMEMMTGD